MDRLDQYELLEVVGQGGMGRVYRARDTRLQREVAVKVLDPRLAGSPKAAARFRREARLAASLHHPNVVTVHDCSPANADVCYLVTELIEGGSLRQRVSAGGLAEEAALILLPVARALGAAHAQGVLHRDVKPDNILVDRSGGGATIKLGDFGVALAASEPRVTTDGSLSGSVAYMAPEQLEGQPCTPSSDVWSFGVTLFELVHGRLPFSGGSVGHLVAEVLTKDPAFGEEMLPRPLDEVLRRCLCRDPARRYVDGSALTEALLEALARSGLENPEQELKSWASASDYSAALAHRLADRLVDQALRTASVQERADLLDRALALVPDHGAALEVLARAPASSPRASGGASVRDAEGSESPRWKPVLLFVAGVALLVALAGGGLLWRRGRPRTVRVSAPGMTRESAPRDGTTGLLVAPRATSHGAETGSFASGSARPDEGTPPTRRTASRPSTSLRAAAHGRHPAGAPALLTLTTEPWAEVFVGGRSLGYTPKLSRIELAPGRTRLLLRNPHCRPEELRLQAKPGEVLVRHVQLEVLPARAEVKAPAGWTVEVDGRPVGKAPLPLLNLSHGRHRVRIVGPSGQTREQMVQAVAGEAVPVIFTEE
jgi:serine/threonine-protein kinase